MEEVTPSLCLIAGNGRYPFEVAEAARAAGVPRIVAIAFHNETDPALEQMVDTLRWLHVGQLGGLLRVMKELEVQSALMAGQIAPKNLFDLRPDWKALTVLARLQRRNAETLFGAIADELGGIGVTLLPATQFMENALAPQGHFGGPKPKSRQENDAQYGLEIAKETSRLDIGQTVIVRNGTVLAVEAFEGTNEAMRRGGTLGKGEATVVKVSKPRQDMRFDVPVIGPITVQTAKEAGIRMIAVESGKTLLLEKERLLADAATAKVTLFGL